MRQQEAIEAALRRRAGMSPPAKERLDAHNERAEWTATSRCCGWKFRGTRAELPAACPNCGRPQRNG